tara:strand:+ start:7248 stop:7514 length:267 start_codon:yes stop_codon:yes gene_type:complete
MLEMKAINNYIIIDLIKESPKKQNGLIIADKHQNEIRYKKAKVISVGDAVKGLNKSDIIYYDKHAGYGIDFEKNLYYVIKEQDVIVVL